MEELPVKRAKWCGKHWIWLDEVGSTNEYLKTGCFPHGTVVIAGRQTAGRGRRGNRWAGAGTGQALYLSALFHSMTAADMGFLPLLCGLAAARSLGDDAAVKWPNDLILGGRKAGGILCESRIQAASVSAICGVGLNLSQPADFFMKNGLDHGTSLLAFSGESRPVLAAAAMFLDELEPLLNQYLLEGFGPILPHYQKRCVTLGQQIRVIREGKTVTANALSIAPDGGLVCENEDGRFVVISGEVSVRGLYGYV